MAFVIVNVGKTKSGKTTRAIAFAKALFEKRIVRQVIANDPQQEEKYRKASFIDLFHYGFDQVKRLLHKTNYKASCRLFILDEMGDELLHGSTNTGVTRCMRAKRFNGNIYILNFHKLSEVPEYILTFTDYIWIGNSRGNSSAIEKKFSDYPEVFEAWKWAVNRAKNKSNRFDYAEIDLDEGTVTYKENPRFAA